MMMVKAIILVTSALALLSAGALAATLTSQQCTTSLNFFPRAEDLGLDVQIPIGWNGNQTQMENCTGAMICNSAVWKESAQTAAGNTAGTTTTAGLLKVLLPKTFDQVLYFKVSSPFLQNQTGNFLDNCIPTTQTTVRKLLVDAPKNVTLTQTGTMSYTISLDNGTSESGTVLHGIGGRLDIPKTSAHGEHCAVITVTVNGFVLHADNGTIPSTFTSTRAISTVCWYKAPDVEHTAADINIDTKSMCNVEDRSITVNVSNISPMYSVLTQNGQDVTKDGTKLALFRPVIHVYGSKVLELDGTTVASAGLDASAAQSENFINKYFIPEMAAQDVFSFKLPSNLAEGFYNVSAKAFLMTKFPTLVGIPFTSINQTDVPEVQGQTEIMGNSIFNELVGIQQSPTTLSEITSDKNGQTLKAGDVITFTWSFVGAGTTKCTHAGVELSGQCESGKTVTVTADNLNSATPVKFVVDFTDVCGNKKVAEYEYTAAGGVKAITAIDVTSSNNGNNNKPVKSAGTITGPVGFLAAAATVLLTAALL